MQEYESFQRSDQILVHDPLESEVAYPLTFLELDIFDPYIYVRDEERYAPRAIDSTEVSQRSEFDSYLFESFSPSTLFWRFAILEVASDDRPHAGIINTFDIVAQVEEELIITTQKRSCSVVSHTVSEPVNI